jgi:hypothetical protein
MATASDDRDRPDPKPGAHKPVFSLSKKFNPGQIGTLLELRAEFSSKDVEVVIRETERAILVDVNTCSLAYSRYVEFLLDRVIAGQETVETMYERPTMLRQIEWCEESI